MCLGRRVSTASLETSRYRRGDHPDGQEKEERWETETETVVGDANSLLGVQSDDEGWYVDDLLADSDVPLPDEDTSVVDRLGEAAGRVSALPRRS